MFQYITRAVKNKCFNDFNLLMISNGEGRVWSETSDTQAK